MRVLKFVMSLNVPSLRRRSAKYLVEFFGCFFRHSRLRFAFLPGLFKCHRRLPLSNFFRIGLLPSTSFRLFFDILSIPATTRRSGLPKIARSISSRAIGSHAGMFSPPFTRPLRFVVFDFVAVAFPPLALIDSVLFSRTHCGIRRRAGLHG